MTPRVVECAPQKVPAAIADELLASGNRTFVAPKGLPTEWMSAGFNWKIDDQLSTEEIEETDGALTAAFCGIADSGTIVLASLGHGGAPDAFPLAGLAFVHSPREPARRNAPRVFWPMSIAAFIGNLYLGTERNCRHRDDPNKGCPRTTVSRRYSRERCLNQGIYFSTIRLLVRVPV